MTFLEGEWLFLARSALLVDVQFGKTVFHFLGLFSELDALCALDVIFLCTAGLLETALAFNEFAAALLGRPALFEGEWVLVVFLAAGGGSPPIKTLLVLFILSLLDLLRLLNYLHLHLLLV